MVDHRQVTLQNQVQVAEMEAREAAMGEARQRHAEAAVQRAADEKEWADKNAKGDAWKHWWYGDEAKNVTYWEFMGKDNVPFHTVGFPVTIMASGEPWKLVDRLKGFNWLNYDGGKFSTSGKRGIFMDKALEVSPADYWR